MSQTLFLSLIILILSIGPLVAIQNIRRSKKDWKTVEELEQKADTVRTADDIKNLHTEVVEKSAKIHNEYCQPRLARLDGS